MILTATGKKRILQISFVFLFLSVQSFLREAIRISFSWMTKPENLNASIFQLQRHKWDALTLSKAQIGFFLMHIIMQIPAGIWAEHYGAKRIMQMSMFYCASISLFTPFCIIFGGPRLMIIIISLQGLGQGCFIPSFYVFTSQWVPMEERSIIFSAAFGGTYFGSAIGIPIIEALCSSYFSWISGYVLSALVGYLWVFASLFVMKAWRSRKRISMRTRDAYNEIIKTIDISEKGVRLGVPWNKILTSVPFWSTMLDHFASVWLNSIFLTDPSYFVHVHHIQPTRVFLSLPYIITLFSIVIFGIWANFMIRLEIKRIIRRRIMNCIALWGGSFLLLLLASFNLSYQPARIIYLFAAVLSGAEYSGVFLNHADLSPFFAGVLMGISNVVGNSATIFKHLVQNYLLNDTNTPEQWQMYFLISSTVIFFSNLPFTLYGSAEHQLWTPHLQWIEDAEPTFRRRNVANQKRKTRGTESLPQTDFPLIDRDIHSIRKHTPTPTRKTTATTSGHKTTKNHVRFKK